MSKSLTRGLAAADTAASAAFRVQGLGFTTLGFGVGASGLELESSAQSLG